MLRHHQIIGHQILFSSIHNWNLSFCLRIICYSKKFNESFTLFDECPYKAWIYRFGWMVKNNICRCFHNKSVDFQTIVQVSLSWDIMFGSHQSIRSTVRSENFQYIDNMNWFDLAIVLPTLILKRQNFHFYWEQICFNLLVNKNVQNKKSSCRCITSKSWPIMSFMKNY